MSAFCGTSRAKTFLKHSRTWMIREYKGGSSRYGACLSEAPAGSHQKMATSCLTNIQDHFLSFGSRPRKPHIRCASYYFIVLAEISPRKGTNKYSATVPGRSAARRICLSTA